MSRGHTLIELATVLALIAATLAVVSPSLRRHRDSAAAFAARESVAGLIAKARVSAIGRGGAEVHLRVSPSIASVVVHGDTTFASDIEDDTGAVLDLGGRGEAVLVYDEVGLGRVASATLRFRRGEAERTLVVSSYGRVRRR